MRAVLPLRRSVAIPAHGMLIGRCRPGIVAYLREIWSAYRRAQDAAAKYERLKPMTDAALARRGLRRADITCQTFHALNRKH
jgi:hypothetical protein